MRATSNQTMYAVLCATPWASVSAKRTLTSVWKWNPSTRETLRMEITAQEWQLAAGNHGMPLEALRFPVTPVGLHYLLIHYDIPVVDADAWRLELGGEVERPCSVSLDELRAREPVELLPTMEGGGDGRGPRAAHLVSPAWPGG